MTTVPDSNDRLPAYTNDEATTEYERRRKERQRKAKQRADARERRAERLAKAADEWWAPAPGRLIHNASIDHIGKVVLMYLAGVETNRYLTDAERCRATSARRIAARTHAGHYLTVLARLDQLVDAGYVERVGGERRGQRIEHCLTVRGGALMSTFAGSRRKRSRDAKVRD